MIRCVAMFSVLCFAATTHAGSPPPVTTNYGIDPQRDHITSKPMRLWSSQALSHFIKQCPNGFVSSQIEPVAAGALGIKTSQVRRQCGRNAAGPTMGPATNPAAKLLVTLTDASQGLGMLQAVFARAKMKPLPRSALGNGGPCDEAKVDAAKPHAAKVDAARKVTTAGGGTKRATPAPNGRVLGQHRATTAFEYDEKTQTGRIDMIVKQFLFSVHAEAVSRDELLAAVGMFDAEGISVYNPRDDEWLESP